MKRLTSLGLAAALVGTLVASRASAQPTAEQDYAVATSSGLYWVGMQRFSIRTLTTTSSPLRYNTASMRAGNTDLISMLAPLIGTQSYLMRIDPQGRSTTMKAIAGLATATAMGPNGQWMIATSEGNVFRTSGLTSTGTTVEIASGLTGANAMCFDDDTGDLIVARFLIGPGGMLLRVDPETGGSTTILSGLPGITAVDHDQRTGNFVVGTSGVLRIVSPAGAVLRSLTTPATNAIHIDDVTGHIHAAGGTTIIEFTEDLRIARSISAPTVGTINGLTVWGSRKLYASTLNSSRAGSTYRFGGAFLDSPNATYVCGLGISGLRPGIAITADHRANIFPDRLFLLSASNPIPFYTTGFVGVTSASGNFSASFVLPPMPPTATPLTVAAAAVNVSKPGNLDLAPSLTVRVLP